VVTAGDYSRAARQAIHEISGRGHLPMLLRTGSICARCWRLFAGRHDQRVARSLARAHRRTAGIFAQAAAAAGPGGGAIDPRNDVPKLVRALEICVAARKPMTELCGKAAILDCYRILRVGLNPERSTLPAH